MSVAVAPAASGQKVFMPQYRGVAILANQLGSLTESDTEIIIGLNHSLIHGIREIRISKQCGDKDKAKILFTNGSEQYGRIVSIDQKQSIVVPPLGIRPNINSIRIFHDDEHGISKVRVEGFGIGF